MTVPDAERLAQIDSDLQALGKTPEELAALRARLPKGSDLAEIDAALTELANGTNGSAVRIAMTPAAPRAPQAAKIKVSKPPTQDTKADVSEGRNTEELIDVESLRVDAPPTPPVSAKPARSVIPGRKLPTAPPAKRSVAPPPPPAPLPAKPPPASAPPKPSHAPPPSASTALADEESIEDVRDDELYENPVSAAARAAGPAASGRGLSVDDLFGDHQADESPFPDLSGSDGIADFLQGDAPRATEGLGPLNLSDELEADMTSVYTGEELRALGSIPPPSSAADLDAELDAFTASAPPARPSQRPLSVADFGADPFAENAPAPAATDGDFELLIDDDALAAGEDELGDDKTTMGIPPEDEFPDEVRTSLEGEAAIAAAEAQPGETETAAEATEGDEPKKKKGFFRKMFGK